MSDDPLGFDQIQSREVEWLWRERIARGVINVVGGRPDQGKGLFGVHVAAEVSRRGGKTIYSAVEDDRGMMTRPRLEAAGAKLENVRDWRFILPADWDDLQDILLADQYDLLVIDPFNAHLGSGVSRFNDSVRTVLTPLATTAALTNTAVLIIEHAIKRVSEGSHPLAALGGSSSGLPAAARMGYLFGVDPNDGDRRILAPAKSNLREAPKAIGFEVDVEEVPSAGEIPFLKFKDELDFDATRLVTRRVSSGTYTKTTPQRRSAAAEWLTEYLARAGKPVKGTTLQEDGKQNGFTLRTIRRAADDMQIVRNPPTGGPKCTWDLPPKVKQTLGLTNPEEEKKDAKPGPLADSSVDALEALLLEGGGDDE